MKLSKDIIHIFTDGACSGNPGPAGAGVVIHSNNIERDISMYLGHGTNSIAELAAIKIGLEHVDCSRHVVVYTDSAYCIGVLTSNWKAKVNKELIYQIKTLLLKFNNIQFVKVKGHSDNIYNERADTLAVAAYKRII